MSILRYLNSKDEDAVKNLLLVTIICRLNTEKLSLRSLMPNLYQRIFKQLFEVIRNKDFIKWEKRIAAVIQVLISCGYRFAEITNLQIGDGSYTVPVAFILTQENICSKENKNIIYDLMTKEELKAITYGLSSTLTYCIDNLAES